jgi:hypothetical protein
MLAKAVVYKVIPSPPQPYWDQFSVLAVHDPYSKKYCLIAAGHTFYALGKSHMTGYTVFTPGIYWSPSYLEMPETEGDLAVAIAKFEKEFDGRKLNDDLLQERRDRVGFQKASPIFYFLAKPVGGADRVVMKVDGYEIMDDIVRVDLRNPSTRAPASYWVDPRQRKVIKSVVDGQEMNVDTPNQPWADPLTK